MAREYAAVWLSIWGDDEFRSLSPRGQHLFFVLLSSVKLSYCGVTDWRPKRIAALAAGWSPSVVESAGAELAARGFVVIDEDTEEVLVRPFVSSDGLMKQPNMAVAMVSAHTEVASRTIRAAVVDEVRKLSVERPDLACWGAKASKDLLARMLGPSPEPSGRGSAHPSVNPSGNPSGKGSVNPSGNPFPKGSGDPSGNPSPTPCSLLLAPSSNTKPTPTESVAAEDHRHPPDSDGLFRVAEDTDAQPRIGPNVVVAAWVEACTANGVTPSTAQRKQVGKSAKELLATNDPHKVLEAARFAGAKGFASIDRELTSLNGRTPQRVTQPVAVMSRTDAALQELASRYSTAPAPAQVPIGEIA